jgi:catechol 2,3-dioxygenase-like lactoylglutathione lyase family enzyme
MPELTGVLETCLYAQDLERAGRFYEELFGFPRIEGDDRFRDYRVADHQVLLLFQRGATIQPVRIPGGIIPPHDGSGHLHLAFSIPSAELDAWEKRLAAQGVSIESKVHWPSGGRSIYFRDLDNHLLELVTPGCWPIY